MGGGIRTSVKGYLLSQRITTASDTVHANESTNRNFTAPQAADSEQETSTDLDSSNSYWLSRFSGSIPCLPILGSASKWNCRAGFQIELESELRVCLTETEIYYLGQLRHPNLVKLIGYCSEDNELLLVYEFMPRGSLENHIFRRSSHFQPLSWTVRMKIALGAAKALAFLHNEAKVIHRDFKTSNILLDSTYNVKISDFGLAVDARAFDRHRGAKTRVKGTYGYAAPEYIETRVMGTYGYAAPEYVATGRLTTKCDVYGFGAVMLEMISGKRVFDRNRPPGEQNLVEWAKPYLFSKHRVLQIFDHHIKGQFSVARALKAVDLAFLCLSRDPKLRPNMNNVVKILEKLQEYSDMDGLGISQNKRRQIRMSVQSMVPNTAGEVALEPAIQHP
ncbi:receptor-like cytoplasmic kinase 176 isoform X3 [Rosa chinensis]|uniref:receptor-like cytoplasmic kinase 176 isoform X3 n=1 Tax=Rosa chinensis TaxID=74649 RepID=UPI001AD94535|nr:receptor-like cytoplasmic kinase 176 isoform X3 [Rosa chinensis]